ncbi:unnamed protein product [Durusdinium trenchii]|uniref:Ankyrin repeat domain-containing protein 17 n=1 Tax=Durusdinium trenchii TaxID=1381693 RepID=A0ABP0SH60_9DINO
MMQVIAASGSVVAQLDEEELRHMVESGKVVRDLKRLLSALLGCSRFQQRLFSDEIGELEDDLPLTPLPSVQLVLLPLRVPDENMQKELLRSCRENQVAHLERLLHQPQDPTGRGVFLAAENGHLEVVQLLLEAGADKDAADANGTTALHMAAVFEHLEIMELLLEAGADQDAANADGTTALYIAARGGHVEAVRLLLGAGARLDATDGETPLYIAAQKGHLEVVRLLLEAGADKDAATTNGETALYIAAQNGNLNVVRLLLEAGADKDTATEIGATAVLIAGLRGHLEVLQLLLEAGAHTDVSAADGL